MTTGDLKHGFHYCMHGLGAYKGLRQTNTLEAFDYWYRKGVRVFEMDFAITEDNQFVAVAHTVDEPSMRRMEIIEKPGHYSFDWFMSQRLFPITTGGLTPISLQMIPSILRKYSDSVIMFDLFGFFNYSLVDSFCKSFNRIFNEYKPFKDRILVEAYNFEMLDALCQNGIKPIYCARYEYDLDKELDVRLRIDKLKYSGVEFISYPFKYVSMFPGELTQYVDAGLTVFSRTPYNTKTKHLKSLGINVNIIAYRFDGIKTPFQLVSYFFECLHRLSSKQLLKHCN